MLSGWLPRILTLRVLRDSAAGIRTHELLSVACFSRIQEMNEPKTLAEVPPSVALELRLPLKPFSISSIQRQQGAIASAVYITDRRFDSDYREV